MQKIFNFLWLWTINFLLFIPIGFAKDIELATPLTNKTSISTDGGAVGIMQEYIGEIYLFGSGLVFVVAVIMLIVGGFEIMFKGGFGGIEEGKTRITQALVGIVLVALSAAILHFINPTFFTFTE